MNKGIRNLYIFVGGLVLVGLSFLAFTGTSRASNISPAGGSVQNNVAEEYTTMSSTNPSWARGKDGAVIQNGPLIFGNDVTTTTLPLVPNIARYSMQEPYYNSSGTAISLGSIIIASSGAYVSPPALSTGGFGYIPCSSTTFIGTVGIVTATTSIWGIAADTCPANTVCNMITHGYALVLTTGNINAGDLIVSSAAASGVTGGGGSVVAGMGGKFTGTVVVGTVIGTAVGQGSMGNTGIINGTTASGGLTAVLIDKQ